MHRTMKSWIWIIVAVGVVLVLKHLLLGRASKDTIQAMLDRGALVVDVRTEAEFAGDHYGSAVNIPLSGLAGRLDELGAKDTPVVLYCHSGTRAASAARILAKAGFTNVTNAGSLHHMP